MQLLLWVSTVIAATTVNFSFGYKLKLAVTLKGDYLTIE
jgi:hypothetical protein